MSRIVGLVLTLTMLAALGWRALRLEDAREHGSRVAERRARLDVVRDRLESLRDRAARTRVAARELGRVESEIGARISALVRASDEVEGDLPTLDGVQRLIEQTADRLASLEERVARRAAPRDDSTRVEGVTIATTDGWIREHGGIILLSPDPVEIEWKFLPTDGEILDWLATEGETLLSPPDFESLLAPPEFPPTEIAPPDSAPPDSAPTDSETGFPGGLPASGAAAGRTLLDG